MQGLLVFQILFEPLEWRRGPFRRQPRFFLSDLTLDLMSLGLTMRLAVSTISSPPLFVISAMESHAKTITPLNLDRSSGIVPWCDVDVGGVPRW